VLVGLLALPIGEGWAAAQIVAWGVFAAGFLQLGLVWAGLVRSRIKLTLPRPRLTSGVKRVIALGAPGALAAGVTQINIVISQMIASTVPGAVSWLSYADRLYQLPLGMIGVAMGVALLPTLSRRLRAEDLDGARASLNRAIEIALFFTLPSAVALGVAAPFWIEGVFERGAFDAADTAATWPLLVAFAAGLPAFIAVKVLSPAFFGREDTKTPMRYAMIAVAVNIVAGLALFVPFGVVGLAAGTSIAAWINTALLARTLRRDGLLAPDAALRRSAPRLLAASAVMGVALVLFAPQVAPLLAGGVGSDLLGLGLLAGAGFAVYAAATVGSGAVRPSDLGRALRRA
jgi:putative peptidoglycan lipid II flippase